jgi:hypothetical protein
MPMRQRAEGWEPEATAWGLLDLRTGAAIDPIILVTSEKIEMTDWELQDFAVQVVRHELEKTGVKLMSWQGNPWVNPSIWFIGASGPESVVVRAARSLLTQVQPPANWQEIAESCARMSRIGHFASVAVANAHDHFQRSPAIPASPLWRGHGLAVQFQGLVAGSDVMAELLPGVMSPEEPEEEMRAYQRRNYRLRGRPATTSPSPAATAGTNPSLKEEQ